MTNEELVEKLEASTPDFRSGFSAGFMEGLTSLVEVLDSVVFDQSLTDTEKVEKLISTVDHLSVVILLLLSGVDKNTIKEQLNLS
jgi:hypothetical protein